jgi:AcrR family transcriptional regulator
MPRAEREALILDAAVREFGASGYAGATVSSIADAADVSKPLVMRYFGSKEDLYIACVTRAGENLATRIEPVLATDAPSLSMAADTLAAIFAGLQARPHDWTVLHDRTVERGSAAHDAARDQRHRITGQGARGVAALAASVPDSVTGELDVDDLAVLSEIWIAVVTAMVQWWLRHPDQTAAQMTQRCYRLLAVIGRLETPAP